MGKKKNRVCCLDPCYSKCVDTELTESAVTVLSVRSVRCQHRAETEMAEVQEVLYLKHSCDLCR